MGLAFHQTNMLLQVTLTSEAYLVKLSRKEAKFRKSSINNPKLTTNEMGGFRKSSNDHFCTLRNGGIPLA